MENLHRRNVILSGVGALAGILGREALAAQCALTVPQQEGPFYPEGDLNRDNDLIQHQVGEPKAKGQVIEVRGQVTDTNCKPVPDALVEIWQACESGKYNHSEDPNNLPLDPNFQYWGRTRTDANGNYLFRTIIPGHYPTSPSTYRPPHIHYKAHAPGFQSLTTQLYFDPNTYENPELKEIVTKWNNYEKVSKRLLVLFERKATAPEVKEGRFDIVLRKI